MVSKEQILAHVRGQRLRLLVSALVDKKHWVVFRNKNRVYESLKKLEQRLRRAGIRVKFLRRQGFYFFFICEEPWLSIFEQLEQKNQEVLNLCLKLYRLNITDPMRRERLDDVVDKLTKLSQSMRTTLNKLADGYRHWVEGYDREEMLRVATELFNKTMEEWRGVMGENGKLGLLFL